MGNNKHQNFDWTPPDASAIPPLRYVECRLIGPGRNWRKNGWTNMATFFPGRLDVSAQRVARRLGIESLSYEYRGAVLLRRKHDLGRLKSASMLVEADDGPLRLFANVGADRFKASLQACGFVVFEIADPSKRLAIVPSLARAGFADSDKLMLPASFFR
jgi:hypothetical protein